MRTDIDHDLRSRQYLDMELLFQLTQRLQSLFGYTVAQVGGGFELTFSS